MKTTGRAAERPSGMQHKENGMKKNAAVYAAILCVWAGCIALLGWALYELIAGLGDYDPVRKAFIIALLSLNTLILAALWLGSIKDLVFSVAYAILHKKLEKRYEKFLQSAPETEDEPRFLLLYCTCNDFNGRALSACKRQDYGNFKTVILDDSSDPAFIKEIDRYVLRHSNVEVIRRQNRKGYKAGNLNNYLRGRTDYDYFVVLDSDEVIPRDYIASVLKYFAAAKNCGAVQARHTASEGENAFQRLMGLSVGSNGTTVQTIKNFYGANALIGHGMTISRQCYEDTGGFPLVVAEDISFAVEIKNAGYEIIYAPDIACTEEFPVSYVSLKKRQGKWTQGNLEYMKKYGKDINRSKMSWFEKLDIKLSHYSLPVVPVLSLMLATCTCALGFLGYPVIGYSLAVYAIMILFLCSPMIPDLFVYRKSRNALLLIPYFLVNVATYASLAPMMICTVAAGLFGKKAVFAVTPKTSEKFTLKDILRSSWDSLLFAAVVGVTAWLACGSILPVAFIVAGCAAAPFVIALSNVPVKGGGAHAEYRSTHSHPLSPERVRLRPGCNFV